MLIEIGLWGIIRLAAALLIFAGPGFALYSFFPNRSKFDKTWGVLLVLLLSASFWIVLLVWLLPLGVRLSSLSAFIVALAGWAAGLIRMARMKEIRRPQFSLDIPRLLLWGLVAGILLVGAYKVRVKVVGAGSDTYHHSLFAQMIMDRGSIPVDYQPYTDQVISFTYHFGFHVVTAVLGWFSGIAGYRMVLIMTVFLIALSALAVAFLAEMITGSRWGGVTAGIVTGVLGVFPTFMLTWGRYPQVAGLIFLAVFLALLKIDQESPTDWRRSVILGILGAGLGATHYRIALITMLGAITLLAAMAAGGVIRGSSLRRRFAGLLLIPAAALALFLPWILHVVISLRQGYHVPATTVEGAFYNLDRIGNYAIHYPTNIPLFFLCGIAAVWGLLRKDWSVIWLLAWVGTGFLIVLSRVSGVFMDLVSFVISLYIPVSVAAGWLAARLDAHAARLSAPVRVVILLAGLGATLLAVPKFARTVTAGGYYVTPDDLPALQWVRENTPQDALFMVNLFHFAFSEEQIIATDAGYWLPLLTGRKTVSLPMPFLSERFRSPEGIDALKKLDALKGKLCSAEAAALLEEQQVSYVFIGSAGGRISPQELQKCPSFSQEFQFNETYVFRFYPSRDASSR